MSQKSVNIVNTLFIYTITSNLVEQWNGAVVLIYMLIF